MAVGTEPNVDVKGLPQQDEKGYIIAGEDCKTAIEGIYAAGDLRTKQLRQVITAAADGANAVTSVQRYLNHM
jgi:thioredoxin reductase (NADPH)